ncbi:M23 family metallopeptidase [Oscillospiraceae bacterium CM]|nr:M23 family metallopeptidase [Oscillospiraceae bacterium CM]
MGDFLAGKGFYVVLFICTAVIGVSAWILLFSSSRVDQAGKDTAANASPQVMVSPTGNHPSTASPSATASPSTTNKPSSTGKSAEAMAKQLTFSWPVVGDIDVGYSVDDLLYDKTMADWRTHNGIDIDSQIGTKVLAVADGTVVDVKLDDLLGTTVIIDHGNGLKSIYANLAKTPVVKKGDKVAMGAVLGAVGDTAIGESSQPSHLHFAMLKDGNPTNPLEYLPKK